MDLESGAGLLHRLTSYTPNREWDVPVDDPRVRHDLVPNDPATLPPPVKQYDAGLPVTPLPRELPDPGVSATAVLAGNPVPGRQLDAAQLGRILYLGAGVVRTSERDGRQTLWRAAGSAGGRFPLEVYASTSGVAGVPDGVHWYDPVEHALVQVGPAPGGAVSTLIVTGVPWRTGWRYAERGWRHLYWDGGTLLSQLIAAADSAGARPRLQTRFADAEIAGLVAGRAGARRRARLARAGRGDPAARLAAADGSRRPTAATAAGLADARGDARDRGAALGGGARRRGHRPGHLPVARSRYPQRQAELRDELLRVAVGQYLAADAGYVVIGAIDGADLDDRGYRDAQLAAGLVEGRLHLAAYALGATASGMTFTDSEVPALLGQAGDLVTLLFTCVGVGRYASRPGGMPGEPVRIRQVTPEFND